MDVFPKIMQQMYNILSRNRSRLTKIQDGVSCHLEFHQYEDYSLIVESVANNSIFAKPRWRLLPFCNLVSAFKLVCPSFVDVEKLQKL